MNVFRGGISKFFIAIFLFYFLVFFYITDSIAWAGILAAFATSPIIILWVLFSRFKRIKRDNSRYREPYIIGNSNEVEYLTPEELEERLRQKNGGSKRK